MPTARPYMVYRSANAVERCDDCYSGRFASLAAASREYWRRGRQAHRAGLSGDQYAIRDVRTGRDVPPEMV